MADDYELQSVTTWRLRELRQHEIDNQRLQLVNAELLAAAKDLLAIYDAHMGGAGISGVRAARAAIAKAESRS